MESNMSEIDSALEYLKDCDDFCSKQAGDALDTLRCSVWNGDVVSYLLKNGFGQLFGRMWSELSVYLEKAKWEHDGRSNLIRMMSMYFDFTGYCSELGEELGKCGGISALLEGLKKLEPYFENEEQSRIEYLIKSMLSTLFNSLSKCSSNRKIFRDTNAFVTFNEYLKSKNHVVSVLSLMTLAYIVDDSESGTLATSGGGVAVLVQWMQKAVNNDNHLASYKQMLGSASELLDCLNHLAINDDNKREIAKLDGIPAILRLLHEDCTEEEQRVAAETVWNLAFIDEIRTSPELQQAIPFLDKLRRSSNRDLRNVSAIAYWELNGNRHEDLLSEESSPQEPPPSYEESLKEPRQATANKPRLMISYQWDFQNIAKLVRDDLVKNDFTVWMDLVHMRDNVLGAMAEAVEKTDVIIAFMSETYKNSQSCRTEAEYAYKLDKKIVPLLVQEGYKPDGWLGALLGAKLYYEFFTDNLAETGMSSLLTALRELSPETSEAGRTPDECDAPITPTQASNVHATPKRNESVESSSASKWTDQEVQEWLKREKLNDLSETLDEFDGRHLEELYFEYSNSPTEFKKDMRSDFQMNAKTYLKFLVALKTLFKK